MKTLKSKPQSGTIRKDRSSGSRLIDAITAQPPAKEAVKKEPDGNGNPADSVSGRPPTKLTPSPKEEASVYEDAATLVSIITGILKLTAEQRGRPYDFLEIVGMVEARTMERPIRSLEASHVGKFSQIVDQLIMQEGYGEFLEQQSLSKKFGSELINAIRQGMRLRRAEEIIKKDPRRFILGAPIGGVQKHKQLGKLNPGAPPTPKYYQQFEYGKLAVHNMKIDVPPSGETMYACDVFIAAVKCFGTDDPGGIFDGGEGEDEPYFIITALNTAGLFSKSTVAQVWKSQTFEEISRGSIFGENQLVFTDLVLGRHGIRLKISFLDHEMGDEETVRAKIQEKADEAANTVKELGSALLGVDIDQALENQDLDDSLLDTLGDVTLDALTDALKDDKIDEKEWIIPANILRSWVDNGTTADSAFPYPPGELPSHIKSNYPFENVFDPNWIFSGGGGSYKIYLRVIPYKVVQDFGLPKP